MVHIRPPDGLIVLRANEQGRHKILSRVIRFASDKLLRYPILRTPPYRREHINRLGHYLLDLHAAFHRSIRPSISYLNQPLLSQMWRIFYESRPDL